MRAATPAWARQPLLCLALLLAACVPASAARPAIVWERLVPGEANHVANADPFGDFFVARNKDACFVVEKHSGQTGQVLWTKSRCGWVGGNGLAVDAAGDVLVALSTYANMDMVTIKYAGADGQLRWERMFPARTPIAWVAGPSGDWFVSGWDGSVTGGRGFTMKLAAADGALQWETSSDAIHRRIAADAGGGAYVGGASHAGDGSSTGSLERLAAADGAVLWRREFPDQSSVWFPEALLADGDAVVATGGLDATVRWDRALTTMRFAASDGVTEWSSVLATDGDDIGHSIIAAPGGGAIVAGVHADRVTLLRYAPGGAIVWQRHVGREQARANEGQHFIATAPDGSITLASNERRFANPLFLSKHRFADGVEAWTWEPRDSESDDLVGLAVTPDGGSVVVRYWGGMTKYAAAGMPEPGATLSFREHDFGGQSMGTRSAFVTLTIGNDGGAPLVVDRVTLDSSQFWARHNCSLVPPGGSCALSVQFRPSVQAGPIGSEHSVHGSFGIHSDDRAGPHVVWFVGTAEKSLVSHYYRTILERPSDAGGKQYWEAEAARLASAGVNVNETWLAMAAYFFESAEYTGQPRDDGAYLRNLYRTFFDREPDAGGLSFWAGQIAQGLPRQLVLTSFMFSAEFTAFTQGIFGGAPARPEVDLVVDLFRGLLGRLPDASGLSYWVGRMRTAQCAGGAAVRVTADEISRGFLDSAEYSARARTDAEFVSDMYNGFLRRGGELAGVRHWIGHLAAHANGREDVRLAFLGSPEFTARVQRVIDAGCSA